eukprot:135795-Prorocentrum_minimum.AAC.1
MLVTATMIVTATMLVTAAMLVTVAMIVTATMIVTAAMLITVAMLVTATMIVTVAMLVTAGMLVTATMIVTATMLVIAAMLVTAPHLHEVRRRLRARACHLVLQLGHFLRQQILHRQLRPQTRQRILKECIPIPEEAILRPGGLNAKLRGGIVVEDGRLRAFAPSSNYLCCTQGQTFAHGKRRR